MWGAPGSKAKGPQPLKGRIYLTMTLASDATQTTGIDRGKNTIVPRKPTRGLFGRA